MAHLQLEHVTKTYGSTTAVDDLTFALEPGSITGLVGVNGAGKTTALRVLLGLTRPTSGRATVDGVPYDRLRTPARCVGALVDPDVFHPGRSGRDALRVLARVSRVPDRQVDAVLGLVGLSDAAGHRVGGYSMGMRQRLGLALALLGDPPTLVLDEPANGLDPVGVHWLRGLLRAFAAEGRTVLVSSHMLAELGQTVDDLVVVHRGRLVAQGAVRDLQAEHGSASLEDLFLALVGEGVPA